MPRFSLCRAGVAALVQPALLCSSPALGNTKIQERKSGFSQESRKTRTRGWEVQRKINPAWKFLASPLVSGLPEEFLAPALLLEQLRAQHCWDRNRVRVLLGLSPETTPKMPTLYFSCSFPHSSCLLVWHELFPTWTNNNPPGATRWMCKERAFPRQEWHCK